MSGVLGGRIPWRCRNICSALKLARQAGLSLPCLKPLPELTLFFFVWGFGYVCCRLGPEAISLCTLCDMMSTQGSWRSGTGAPRTPLVYAPSQFLSIAGTTWEAEVPEAAGKLQIQGIAQNPVVFLDRSSGYRCLFSRCCLTLYIFITVLMVRPHRTGLVCIACMN